MPESRTALLVDGTALYFRSKEERSERLDYEALNDRLLASAQVSAFDPALFFTTYDPSNEGQNKFLSFVRARLGWTTETRPVWEADPLPRDAPRSDKSNAFVRFDAPIAFALGRLCDRRDRIIVLSDSYGLCAPMLAAAEYDAEIVLAFFGRQVDPRWHSALAKGSRVQLLDLDAYDDELFGSGSREREPEQRPGGSALGRLS